MYVYKLCNIQRAYNMLGTKNVNQYTFKKHLEYKNMTYLAQQNNLENIVIRATYSKYIFCIHFGIAILSTDRHNGAQVIKSQTK